MWTAQHISKDLDLIITKDKDTYSISEPEENFHISNHTFFSFQYKSINRPQAVRKTKRCRRVGFIISRKFKRNKTRYARKSKENHILMMQWESTTIGKRHCLTESLLRMRKKVLLYTLCNGSIVRQNNLQLSGENMKKCL